MCPLPECKAGNKIIQEKRPYKRKKGVTPLLLEPALLHLQHLNIKEKTRVTYFSTKSVHYFYYTAVFFKLTQKLKNGEY